MLFILVNLKQRMHHAVWQMMFGVVVCLTAPALGDVDESLEGTSGSVFASSDVDELLHEDGDFTKKFRVASHTAEPEIAEIVATTVSSSNVRRSNCYRHRVMPSGLLYRSYIAAPHEPRFSSAALIDTSAGEARWDATLGSRVGLYRRENPPRMNLDAWQIDIEGAAMVRLDPQEKMDLEAGDYRFGLLWTGKRDNLALKFGYFHMSSHVGDEYLIKNPTFERINYVRESLIMGASLQASPQWRVYGEVGWAAIATGGAEPWQLQLGTEYARLACRPTRGAPFVALNIQMREEVDFAPGVSILTGWQWRSPETGKAFRVGMQFFNGPSNQYQFYQQYDNQLGFGVWYDF